MCTHSIIHIPFQLLVLLPIAPLGAPRAGSRAGACSRAGTRTGARTGTSARTAEAGRLLLRLRRFAAPASGARGDAFFAAAFPFFPSFYTAEEVNYAQIATTSDATMLQPLGAAGGRPGVSPAIDRRTQ